MLWAQSFVTVTEKLLRQLDYNTRREFHSHWEDFNSNLTATGYLKDKSATIAQSWWSCQCSRRRCGSLALQLDRIICVSSSLAASTAPSETTRASPQGGGLQISSSSVPRRPASKVCGVFNNRVITSCSGRQPRAVATDCCLGSLLDSPDKGALEPNTRVFVHLQLLEGALLSQEA